MEPIIDTAPDGQAPQVQTWRVEDESAGQRLDNFLLRHLKGVPKTHVYRIIRKGEVRVNKARAQADTRLQWGDLVRVPPVRVATRAQPSAAPGKEYYPTCRPARRVRTSR